jgi:hypothetical protein
MTTDTLPDEDLLREWLRWRLAVVRAIGATFDGQVEVLS